MQRNGFKYASIHTFWRFSQVHRDTHTSTKHGSFKLDRFESVWAPPGAHPHSGNLRMWCIGWYSICAITDNMQDMNDKKKQWHIESALCTLVERFIRIRFMSLKYWNTREMDMPRGDCNIYWQIKGFSVHELLILLLFRSWHLHKSTIYYTAAICSPLGKHRYSLHVHHTIIYRPMSVPPTGFHAATSTRAAYAPATFVSVAVSLTNTHTQKNKHSSTLPKGAFNGGDIKHMEVKYVWARAHQHIAATTLFDERPAEIKKVHFSRKYCTFRSCPVLGGVALCLQMNKLDNT